MTENLPPEPASSSGQPSSPPGPVGASRKSASPPARSASASRKSAEPAHSHRRIRPDGETGYGHAWSVSSLVRQVAEPDWRISRRVAERVVRRVLAQAARLINSPPGPASRGSACPAPSAGPPADPAMATPRVRVDSPSGILAVVPHLLGFRPSNSIVVIGLAPPRARIKVGFRYDLPDPPDAAAAAEIARHAMAILARQRITMAVGVGYGPGSLVTPVADALRAAAGRARLTLREVLRAENGRYWSELCSRRSWPLSAVLENVREDRAGINGPMRVSGQWSSGRCR